MNKKSPAQINPREKPDQTCFGEFELSHNLDVRTSPDDRIAPVRNQGRLACILIESIAIRATRAPEPAAWIDIFHQKFMMVIKIDRNATVSMNDLMNAGI
jgi:hypothetical protein